MTAKDQFVQLLSPDFTWQHIGAGTILLTAYGGEQLPCATRLELDDGLFERYVRRVARTTENGDREAALGLVYVHLEEELSAAAPDFGVRAIGLRRSLLGRPRWFAERVPSDELDQVPQTIWAGEPPDQGHQKHPSSTVER